MFQLFLTAIASLLALASPALPAPEPPFSATPLVVPADQAAWQPYDAGKLKMLVSAASTGGRFAMVELEESPEYKTPPHLHPELDETFYVLEGTLELQLPDKTYRLAAGSFVHVPRNTPHAQGSADGKPVRLLVKFSPGGFEEFFLDRAALVSRTPREHPDFRRLYLEIVRKHSRWLQPASLSQGAGNERRRQ